VPLFKINARDHGAHDHARAGVSASSHRAYARGNALCQEEAAPHGCGRYDARRHENAHECV